MQDLQTNPRLLEMRSGSPFRLTRLSNGFSRIGDVDINNIGVSAFSGASSGFELSGIYRTRNSRNTDTIANDEIATIDDSSEVTLTA